MSEDFLKIVQARNFTVIVKLDTAGRKGRQVTVLTGLPKQELFLNGMLKTLKKLCGAGGTFLADGKEGVVELQGDHRERVCSFLEKNQMKFRQI